MERNNSLQEDDILFNLIKNSD